jgi:hypothetical protein
MAGETAGNVTPREARAALESIEHDRIRVVGQIDLPAWYWWGLAACWVGLGVLSDLGNVWVISVATLAFGAVHSAIAPRIVSGRHRTQRLSVRADLAGPQVPIMVFAALVVLVGVTIGLAFAAQADGARHPAVVASIVVALLILLGGPRLLGIARRRAARAGWPS